MSDLTAVSLFAGIGGFDLALKRAGVNVCAAVEIDPACRGVLARHFPETRLFNDVTEVSSEQLRAAGFVPERGVIAGGFPCFVAGTRILTADGWKPIEDVQVGELVLTHAGRWMPVTSTMSRVSDHQVALRGQGLPHVLTTEEHPFYARASSREWVGRNAGSWRRKFADPEWTDAAKMAGQFASQILPPVEQNEGSADLWWLVGRYLADGWTTTGSRRPSGAYKGNRVVICCAHSEADELAERIDRVVHATRSEDLTATKFIVTRRWFVDFVDRLGRGAAGKTLTRRELTLPADKADALLSGWLSGDGCRTRGQWKGTTVSRSLALSMALLAQRARGIVASLHETAMPPSDVIAGRVVGQRTQYQVVIPDRNRSAFVEGAYGWKLVRSATRADGPVLVYNISVAGDESYVADGAVVHNCQDLSVAGRRAGLVGARSGLFWHIMRLADELRPQWLVLENVPGLLSAVCSCPGDGTCTANARAVRCGEYRGDAERREWFPNVPHAVPGGACAGQCMPAHGGAMGTVLGALGKRGYGFAYRVLDAQFFGVPQRRERVFIVGCLGDRTAPVEVLLEPEVSAGHPAAGRAKRKGPAATAGGGAVSTLQGGGRRGHRIDAEGAAGGHLVAVPIQDGRGLEKAQNGVGLGRSGDPSYTLDATGGQSVAAFPVAIRGREGGSAIESGEPGDPMFTLRTPGGGSSHPMVAMAFNPQTGGSKARLGYGEKPTALSCTQATGVVMACQGYGAVRTAAAVRRLTPMERERLQGFPDDWTRWKLNDGHLLEQPDSARDRQTGNAVAVPVVEWITRRLAAVDQSLVAADLTSAEGGEAA